MNKNPCEHRIWRVFHDIDLRSVKWDAETLKELGQGLPKGYRMVFFNIGMKKRRDIVNLGRTTVVECFKTGKFEVSEHIVEDYIRTGTDSTKVKKDQKVNAIRLEGKRLKRDTRERKLREMHLQPRNKKRHNRRAA
jgi:hypothetical protein